MRKKVCTLLLAALPACAICGQPPLYTPGHGISNYFELAPDKVQNGASVRPFQSVFFKPSAAIKSYSKGIRIEFQKGYKGTPVIICLFDSRGRILTEREFSSRDKNTARYDIPATKGLYVIQIKFGNSSITKAISLIK
jgi:hypothetical protein